MPGCPVDIELEAKDLLVHPSGAQRRRQDGGGARLPRDRRRARGPAHRGRALPHGLPGQGAAPREGGVVRLRRQEGRARRGGAARLRGCQGVVEEPRDDGDEPLLQDGDARSAARSGGDPAGAPRPGSGAEELCHPAPFSRPVPRPRRRRGARRPGGAGRGEVSGLLEAEEEPHRRLGVRPRRRTVVRAERRRSLRPRHAHSAGRRGDVRRDGPRARRLPAGPVSRARARGGTGHRSPAATPDGISLAPRRGGGGLRIPSRASPIPRRSRSPRGRGARACSRCGRRGIR